MGVDMSVIWAGIIVLGVFMYVVMDGFDLGVGMLFPFFQNRHDRDVMMNTIAPVWDGNETWLVLGGAGLMAAFPVVYSAVLSALYLPMMLMLVGLILRGVAFEFRFRASDQRRHIWDKAFAGGSLVATAMQGVTLGALLSGLELQNGVFVGGAFDWLSPFSVFTGLGLVAAYMLLGSTWLVMKTEGPLQQGLRRAAKLSTVAMAAAIAVVSLWTPLLHDSIAQRWFGSQVFYWFLPVPLLVLACLALLWRTLGSQRRHGSPFGLALALVFLGYTGLVISIMPVILPPSLTIWQAAAPASSQGFALVGALFIIPIILGYTAWSYYVFRGKVRHGEAYH
ncbi:MAG: cytochrome d ubiquinol oxidase subunit II [Acidovorax sp.]|jgi:cytochrome d ubiquinol oxidase subunit II|nr:cytochrome d ubiquinol oxidase subunit II [Acidovorax sp.]